MVGLILWIVSNIMLGSRISTCYPSIGTNHKSNLRYLLLIKLAAPLLDMKNGILSSSKFVAFFVILLDCAVAVRIGLIFLDAFSFHHPSIS